MKQYHTQFEEVLTRHAALGKIYLSLAVVTVVSLSFSLQAIAIHEAIPDGELDTYIDAVVFYFLGYIMEGFALWILITFVLFFLSLVSGGRPYMGYLIRIVGIGMAPMAISSVFWSIGRFQALNGQSPPDLRLEGISFEFNAIGEYVSTAAGDPVAVQFTLLGCVFFVISGYVWAVGTKYAADISMGKATAFSAVCVLGYGYWKLAAVLPALPGM